MKFQGNRDFLFCVLMLEVQQSQFGTRSTVERSGRNEIIIPLCYLNVDVNVF